MADEGPRYGHIKISRKAYDADPFWNEPREFSRWEAWEYMIQAASFKPTQWTAGGAIVRLERGETPPLSLSFLCRAWNWSTKKVRVFLDLLIQEERVQKRQETPQGHTYLLVNYGVYQGQGHSEGTAGARPGQQSEAVKKGSTTTPKKRRATQLPSEWAPSDSHRSLSAELRVDIDLEAEKFRDHAIATGRTLKDWDAGFRMWLRKAKDFTNGRKDGGTKRGRSTGGDVPQSYNYDEAGGGPVRFKK